MIDPPVKEQPTDKASLGQTAIHDLQGSTPSGDVASPQSGKAVKVGGIVTSLNLGTGALGGFFVQEKDLDADKDSATSEGLFVYCGTSKLCDPVKVGDAVQVAGTLAEFGGATQLGTLSEVTLKASGAKLPTPAVVTFPLANGQGDLERFEGMLITVPTTLSVTSTYELGRYGQLTLSSGGRIFNSTNGQAGTASDIPKRTLLIDDGLTTQNPAVIPFLSGTAPVSATRRAGDTITNLTGVLNSALSAKSYFVYPSATTFVDANPRPAAPKAVGGTLSVAGANVLNYFTALASSNSGCTPDGIDKANARGADDCVEFLRQQTKVVQALKGLNADVVTLMEVQNNTDKALDNLTAALNKAYGTDEYTAIQTGSIGSDQIHVAILYKPLKVLPEGAFKIDNNPVYSRPPLAQTFSQVGTGQVFSVIANHFKSKGGCPKAGTDQPNDDSGQGCWNALRREQAAALLGFVKAVQTSSNDPDVLLMGDFNAYGAEDPVNDLVAGGFESLNMRIPAEDRYSYQFNGAFGYLDHAFGSASLTGQVTGITEWHINSDEPVVFDYNTEFKKHPNCTLASCTSPDLNNVAGSPTPFRASDHDPVLVGLNLSATPVPVSEGTPLPSTSRVNPAKALPARPNLPNGPVAKGRACPASVSVLYLAKCDPALIRVSGSALHLEF